ncbi:zinc-dependent metalloprotease [uncultured Propionibacterium sp.]|uniref:zinc-dependent metalloprotease n=1 Tax=uncultured Propionibacterium sp. TaxID=218066 RepID=UPI0029319FA5|nr:zinc-dependent metalloprotease [uncultured Propionibacterium sp.]
MSDDNTSHPAGESGNDPLSELLRQLGIDLPAGGMDLNAVLGRLQSMMAQAQAGTDSATGIDWTMARRTARQVAAALGSDPVPSRTQRTHLADSHRLAESWLDPVVSFEACPAPAQAWSRAQWIEDTMDSWRTIVEPVVTSIAGAMSSSLGGQAAAELPEMAQLTDMLAPIMRTAAGQMYTAQLARAIGEISTEVISGAELGLQLLSSPRVVLLPTNAEAFVRGLGLPDEDTLMYIVVREAARQRLFSSVKWLAPQMLALIEHYAHEITIDTTAIGDAIGIEDVSEMTPAKLAELSERLQGRLFKPARTPEQEDILARLETLLALVEGWVDSVAHEACAQWLAHEPALLEAVRRRRATDGPAEKIAGALLGLQLRPRLVRESARFWQVVLADRGVAGRDGLWAHPDLMPAADDVEDPIGFVQGERHGEAEADWDSELAKLLERPDQGPDPASD